MKDSMYSMFAGVPVSTEVLRSALPGLRAPQARLALLQQRGAPLNFSHFCERVRQFASADAEGMTVERFRSELKEKLRSVSMDAVRRDVEPFVRDVHAPDIWSTDYFCALADMLRVE